MAQPQNDDMAHEAVDKWDWVDAIVGSALGLVVLAFSLFFCLFGPCKTSADTIVGCMGNIATYGFFALACFIPLFKLFLRGPWTKKCCSNKYHKY